MNHDWYLKKHDDDEIHGPVDLEQLRDWSLSAMVSPLDRVSDDGKQSWRRAPMIAELHMDWLVEVSEDFLYGPTTFGAVQEFLAAGEITGDNYITNTIDGSRSQIRNMPAFRQPRQTTRLERDITLGDSAAGPMFADRILKLENMLIQQRRALEAAELRYQKLREKYIEETGRTP